MKNILDSIYYFFNGSAKLLHRKIRHSGSHKVCIYGAGIIGSALIDEIKATEGIEIHSVVDRKADYISTQVNSIEVKVPASIQDLDDDVSIVIASEAFVDEIQHNIRQFTQGKTARIITI